MDFQTCTARIDTHCGTLAQQLRRMVLAAGAALMLLASAAVQAQAAPSPAQSGATGAPAGAAASTLLASEIRDRLVHIGYRDLQEIRWADGLYKLKATSADGRAVKLYVDARSGTLVDVHTRR